MDIRSLAVGAALVICGLSICNAYQVRQEPIQHLSEGQLNILRSSLVCGFYADSSSIPIHYETEEEKIVGAVGDMDSLKGPLQGALTNGITQYHRRVSRGGYTHCGYETLLVMNFLKNTVTRGTGVFMEKYAESWFTNNGAEFYNGYMPTAAKRYWVSVSKGNTQESSAQQNSNDLCALARIPPLLALFPQAQDEDAFVEVAVNVTKMTHAHPNMLEASEFVSRVLHRMFVSSTAENSSDWTTPHTKDTPLDELPYMRIKKLLDDVAKDLKSEFVSESLGKAVSAYRSSEGKSDIQVLNKLGKSSLVDHSFPGLIFTFLKYVGRKPPQFLLANALGGGDSAARGVILGAVMCAMPGFATRYSDHINDMLEDIAVHGSISRFLSYARKGVAQIPQKKPEVKVVSDGTAKRRQRKEDILRCEIDKEQKPKCWIQKNVVMPERTEATDKTRKGVKMPGF